MSSRRDQATTSFHRISSRPFISRSGEKRRAIELLEQAYSEDSVDIVKAKIDSKLNGLRSEPRFETLVQRLDFRSKQRPLAETRSDSGRKLAGHKGIEDSSKIQKRTVGLVLPSTATNAE